MIDCKKYTDLEVVSKSLDDTEYFRCIIERYKNKMVKYVRRHLYFSQNDIDDILQDSYIKIYRNLNGFDQSLPLENWIYRITYTTLIDYYRRTKRHVTNRVVEAEDEDLFANIASHLDISVDVDAARANEKIMKAIAALKPKLQEVAILRFIEDKSYQEISDIVQKPVGSVGSTVNRAREKLAELLNAEFQDE